MVRHFGSWQAVKSPCQLERSMLTHGRAKSVQIFSSEDKYS